MIENFRIKAVEGNNKFKYREGRIVKVNITDITIGKSLAVRYFDGSCFLISHIKEIVDNCDELKIIAEGQNYVLEKI